MKKEQNRSLILVWAAICLISGCLLPSNVRAQLLPPPKINVQPLDQTVTNMGSVTFSVTLDASLSLTLHYQWQFNGVNLTTPGSSGTKLLTLTADTISYTQPANNPSMAGNYSVKLTSTLGAAEVSSNAVLKVITGPPVAITSANHSANGFKVHLSGITGVNYVLYASSNLVNWAPVYTNTSLLGTADYTDAAALNLPARYYKVLVQ